ncbi:MFS transporter [Vasconcelosia minhoensis]|uniref:MFS transporter n=1 Tax=Vasconcelosia minhoensis TaxID=3366354 RepID=UPI002AD1E03C|nr:MFS transporter [Romeria gracilis]
MVESYALFVAALMLVGGSLLIPGSLAIISAAFTEAARGRAIGLWSGFTAITSAAGPVLGDWLIEVGSWRWIFFMNLPIAIAVFSLSLDRRTAPLNLTQAAQTFLIEQRINRAAAQLPPDLSDAQAQAV